MLDEFLFITVINLAKVYTALVSGASSKIQTFLFPAANALGRIRVGSGRIFVEKNRVLGRLDLLYPLSGWVWPNFPCDRMGSHKMRFSRPMQSFSVDVFVHDN